MLNFGSRQTTLDLNGPILSFTTQPVGVITTTNDNATFTGIATATFPTQSPENFPTNTGYLAYQWYEVGVGALSNSSTISGAGTTTLTITGLRSPQDSGRRFFLKADYVASAYNTTGLTTVGTARSTGNALNDGLDSDIVTLSIYPTISITKQPTSQTVSGAAPAVFEVDATTTDSSDNSLIYNWLLNGTLLSDSATVSNSNTKRLTISLPARYDTTIYHEISSGDQNVTTVFNVTNTGDFKATASAKVIGGAVFNGLDPGSTLNNDNRRHYDIKFESDLGTTNYDVEITNIIPISAKGTPDTTIGVGYISKRTDGFRVWFYRSGDFVCSQPAECMLYVWPPNSGAPTDTSVSGSQNTPFRGMSINLANPASFSQQFAVATGINYSGTFTFSGTMNSHSPSKTTEFRIRAVLPNGTTVATSGTTSAGSNGNFSVSLNFGPLSTLEPLTLVIDARFPDNRFQSGIDVSSSSVSWSGTYRTYLGTVYTVDTHVRGFQFSLLSANKIQARVSHPAANNSPIYSNVVDYNIVSARKIISLEKARQEGSSSAILSTTNVFFEPFVLAFQEGDFVGTIYSFYASERNIEVLAELYGSSGANNGGYVGGEGGVSVIRFTMEKDVEYIVSALPQATGGAAVFMWRKASLMACCGGGGDAGNSGNGGNGGGVNVAGGNGSGRGAGAGGALFLPGTLPTTNGIFGSLSGQAALYSGDSRASAPDGGRVLGCTKGGTAPGNSYWMNRGFSPCQDVGVTQLVNASGYVIPNTAFIQRGHKVGYACRQTAGRGLNGGGNGANGATGGQGGNGGGGGGGGSGYSDGSYTIVSTQQGGYRGPAKVIIRNIP